VEDEQGAWWQVDLGGKKKISQIIIYNRTDCCVDRLSNYQVSVSDKADFSTHTYLSLIYKDQCLQPGLLDQRL
jgi:hypothetical protein